MRRKALTIAAGFMCTDGVVICADTQHTTGISKFDKGKIEWIAGPAFDTWMVVAGAGDSSYIAMVLDELRTAFPRCKSLQAAKRLISKTILQIYKDHIVPFWNMSDSQCPVVALIVAARIGGKVRLWEVSSTAVSVCGTSGFVGIGADTADRLSRWLYSQPLPLRVAAPLAAEILAETKRTVPDCGGKTHICVIPNGEEGIGITGSRAHPDREFCFGLNVFVERAILAALDPARPENALDQAMTMLHSRLRKVREKMKASPSDILSVMRTYSEL